MGCYALTSDCKAVVRLKAKNARLLTALGIGVITSLFRFGAAQFHKYRSGKSEIT